MKIVVDTNMVIAALVKDSAARQVIMNNRFEFISPDFVFDEIHKYEDEILENLECQKTNLNC